MKTISDLKGLKYEEVTYSNIAIALQIQKETWKNDDATNDFIEHIEKNLPEFKDYIVYYDNKPSGLTGTYVEDSLDAESIWLSWFCVLPEFRRHGLGKIVLNDTIEHAKSFNKFKHLRLNTTFWEGRPAIAFYDKCMQFKENYTVEDTETKKYTYRIYTTNLTESKVFVPWGDKNIGIANEEKYNNYKVL